MLVAVWYSAVVFACAASWSCGEEPLRSPTVPTAPVPQAASSQPSLPSSPVQRLRLLSENGERGLAFGEGDLGQHKGMRFQLCNEATQEFFITDIQGPVGFQISLDYEYMEVGIPAPGCATGSAYFVPLAVGVHEGGIRVESDRAVEVEGRLSGTGIRPPVPRTVFADGSHLVNVVIAPGRYFAEPNGTCWWGRTADFVSPLGNFTDFIAQRASSFDPGQWIVDILLSDFQFMSSDCGWWGRTPSRVADREVIDPGMWLVNRQIRPGRYRTAAAPGCDWERLRHFQGTPDGVITSGWSVAGAVLTLDIKSTDAGFLTNTECGQWRRVS